jgi:Cytochrome c7 and related cytochrome c
MQTLKSTTLLVMAASCAWIVSASASHAGELYFPHSTHVEDNGIDCDACHETALTSAVTADDLRPTMDTCGECHDVEADDECSLCHRGGGDPESYVDTDRAVDFFGHRDHLGRGLECSQCHEDLGARAVRPATMEDCRSCHATQSALNDCVVCHSEGATFSPDSHGPGWESWHGVEARAGNADCESCHAQSDCQQCHTGDNVSPRVHPTGFEYRHALDAQISAIECESCHNDRAFCSSCHASQRVLPENHSFGDWANFSGDGGQHAVEARFDLESCLACHEDGSKPICARCHGD